MEEAAWDARTEEFHRLSRLLNHVKWYIVGQGLDGTATIEAYVDGEPVYRFRGYYCERTGEWRIYAMCILRPGYEVLNRVRHIDVFDVRRLDLLLERGEKP